MATVKIPEYRCPHCNKKLPATPVNDYCAINFKCYGNPYAVCRKCGQTYRDMNLVEPAAALTLKDGVPFWITGVRTLVFMIIAIIATFGVGLIVVAPAYLLLCFLSRNYRLQHKNDLLLASRARLRDPAYFARHLLSVVYLPDKSKLTPEALAIIHSHALAMMDADEVLELGPITHTVIGE